jgi:hypothetical protein
MSRGTSGAKHLDGEDGHGLLEARGGIPAGKAEKRRACPLVDLSGFTEGGNAPKRPGGYPPRVCVLADLRSEPGRASVASL